MDAIACTCERCVAMCGKSPCVPTPDEARELIRRGYGARLATYAFRLNIVAPASVGREGQRGLPYTALGACTFLKDGRCELHDKGLKPREGRLAHHTRDPVAVRLEVLRHWTGKRFESVLAKLDNEMVTS